MEQLRKTEQGKALYRQRKETIERVFADAKEKHAMRDTHHRGMARVTNWVRLKYAAMNLKTLANWSWNSSFFYAIWLLIMPYTRKTICWASSDQEHRKPPDVRLSGGLFFVGSRWGVGPIFLNSTFFGGRHFSMI